MGLLDLKTDLKSLRYGQDTPGGGDSGQPYIKSKIPEGYSAKSSDFLLRNGYLAPRDALTDVARLTKMFFDLKSPNGLLFTAKQNLLSNSAVRTQTSGVLNEGIYTPLSTLAQAGVIAGGYHLNKQGINPFADTGAYAKNPNLYFNKVKESNKAGANILFSSSTFSAPKIKDIVDDVIVFDTSNPTNSIITFEGKFTNRLASLWYDKVYTKTGDVNILSYRGGPGSLLGVGTTNIRFADQRTGINSLKIDWLGGPITWTPKQTDYKWTIPYPITNTILKPILSRSGVPDPILSSIGPTRTNINIPIPSVYKPGPDQTILNNNDEILYANGSATYTQKQIEESPNNKNTGAPKLQDFRKIIRENSILPKNIKDAAEKNGSLTNSPSYTDFNYEKRVNIGGKDNAGPGNSSGKNLTSYSNGSGIGPIDKINYQPIYRSDKVTDSQEVNDLVKFRIAAIDNNAPKFKTFMHFRAFIDSFSDSYTGEWDSVRYLGRGEKFYNYKGFDRTISLAFTVAAQSKNELIPMYQKLNYLASNLAPDYSEFGYMRGPLVELTMGGYLYEQVGFITQLTYDIPEESPWEIGINDEGGSDNTVKELSHMIRVTGFSFTPIHNFVPSKQGLGFGGQALNSIDQKAIGEVTSYGLQRYIALSAGAASNYDR